MDKKSIIQNLNNNVFFQVKPSQIDGLGLYAIKNIQPNVQIITNLTPIIGYHFSQMELKKLNLNPEIISLCQKYFQPKDKKKIFIPQDPNVLSSYYLPNYFVNHSENPNVINSNGNIITIKNIEKDEEITIDYKKYYPSLFKNLKKTKKKHRN